VRRGAGQGELAVGEGPTVGLGADDGDVAQAVAVVTPQLVEVVEPSVTAAVVVTPPPALEVWRMAMVSPETKPG